jgi:hypothetical protein
MTDGTGWFDDTHAVKFTEATRWNGNNHISRATGSQWDHQALYYTRSGNWVLNGWSQWQGSLETYTKVDETEAIQWLIDNEHDDTDELPESVRERIDEGIEAAEL